MLKTMSNPLLWSRSCELALSHVERGVCDLMPRALSKRQQRDGGWRSQTELAAHSSQPLGLDTKFAAAWFRYKKSPIGALYDPSAGPGQENAPRWSATSCSPTDSLRSTIGARGLNFRVRNGTGCASPAMVADQRGAFCCQGGGFRRALGAAQRDSRRHPIQGTARDRTNIGKKSSAY